MHIYFNYPPYYIQGNSANDKDKKTDYTVQDLIEYFREILNEGGVSGTDFELNDNEKEIYKRTIICLIALLTR